MFIDTQERPAGEVQQKVGRLSDIIRECGYGNAMEYTECVLGRAYTRVTGRNLHKDGIEFGRSGNSTQPLYFVEIAATALGVPYEAAREAECMCISRSSPSAIADWLEAQGL